MAWRGAARGAGSQARSIPLATWVLWPLRDLSRRGKGSGSSPTSVGLSRKIPSRGIPPWRIPFWGIPYQRNPFLRNSFRRNPFLRNSFQRNPFLRNSFLRNSFRKNHFLGNSLLGNTFQSNPFQKTPLLGNSFPEESLSEEFLPGEFLSGEFLPEEPLYWEISSEKKISQGTLSGKSLPEESLLEEYLRGESVPAGNHSLKNPFLGNPFQGNSSLKFRSLVLWFLDWKWYDGYFLADQLKAKRTLKKIFLQQQSHRLTEVTSLAEKVAKVPINWTFCQRRLFKFHNRVDYGESLRTFRLTRYNKR